MKYAQRIIILAGGRSLRMGENKARLVFNNKALLHRLVEDAHQLGLNIAVCADNFNYPELRFEDGITYYPDLLPNKSGALSAIQPALEEAYLLGERWAWIYACDSLLLPSEIWPYFLPIFDQADQEALVDTMMILPKSEKLLPLMGLYRTSLYADLKNYLVRGNRRVMSFCAQHKSITLPIPAEFNLCCNFNTPIQFDLGKTQYSQHHKIL